MNNKIAVQFGAGQIGRGFTGALFHESGHEVVFAEYVQSVVHKLNEKKSYVLKIVGEGAGDQLITNIRALHTSNLEEIGEALSEANIACTAVGVPAMEAVAPLIAEGVQKRFERGLKKSLNILICENQINGDAILRDMVKKNLAADTHKFLDDHIGFALCVVSRMVPIATEEERENLTVRVEAYNKLPVDKKALKEPIPDIVGLQPVDNFQAYIERKLFVHNAAHAVIGYLGWKKGYEYGWQALEDKDIKEHLFEAMTPALHALALRHGFSDNELKEHFEDLVRRFANKDLGDTNFRLCRDPLRKLRRNDRLIGSAILIQEYGLNYSPMCEVIVSALKFDAKEDPSSQKLQDMLSSNGLEDVLKNVCGLDIDEPVAQTIINIFNY